MAKNRLTLENKIINIIMKEDSIMEMLTDDNIEKIKYEISNGESTMKFDENVLKNILKYHYDSQITEDNEK